MKSFKIGNLTIPVPVIQGGMGVGISMSGLASAVANMGGIGVIATVGISLTKNKKITNYKSNSIQDLREEIHKAQEKTNGILGVNIMSVLTNFSDMVRTSIEEGVDIIFSGAGLPLDLPKYLSKDSKTKLVPIVSSGRAASILCTKWKHNFNYLPDALVVEGPKAGGHLGFKLKDLSSSNFSLEKLLAEVLEVTNKIKEKYKKSIPVIAAGGIFSGKDVFDILKKGASAVQMGTRFIASKECDASDGFKNAFLNVQEKDIQIIKSPVGMPGRALLNKFLLESEQGKRRPTGCKYNCIKSCNPKTTSFCIADALQAAFKGELDNGFVFTGANAAKIDKISTVDHIFNDLHMEYLQAENEEDKSQPFKPSTFH